MKCRALQASLTFVFLSSHLSAHSTRGKDPEPVMREAINVRSDLAPATKPCSTDPINRAYIISRDSPDLHVIDLDCMEMVGRMNMGSDTAHMAEFDEPTEKLLVSSTGSNELITIDARKLEVESRMLVGSEPTHVSIDPVNRIAALMLEGDNAVSLINADTRKEVKRIIGLETPHFMQFTSDGTRGFIANINGNFITEVNMKTLEKTGEITFKDGYRSRKTETEEGGFADVQIDRMGRLFAAHRESGRVLVYDTLLRQTATEIPNTGANPWVVFANNPFDNVPLRHLMPAFTSQSIALIDGAGATVKKQLPGDSESYGVNYNSRVPDRAFVMQRQLNRIAVVNTRSAEVEKLLPVGGYTETASTTADGRFVIATVSGANRVVVIDTEKAEIVKSFENVGIYPWSVVIPRGQNYCH